MMVHVASNSSRNLHFLYNLFGCALLWSIFSVFIAISVFSNFKRIVVSLGGFWGDTLGIIF